MTNTGPLTTGIQFVRPPQYVEESQFGTLPTSSPALNFVNPVYDINPQVDMDPQEINYVAHEDGTTVLPGMQKYTLVMSSYIENASGSNGGTGFLKYGVNAQGGGSGTIDKSLSIFWSQTVAGVESFHYFTGCKMDSIKIKGIVGKPLQVDYTIKGYSFPVPGSSNPLTTPTYGTDPGNSPWNWTAGGAGNVSIGGASNFDVNAIDCTISRNIKEVYTMSGNQPTYLVPTVRKVVGTMKIAYETASNINAMGNLTDQQLVWTLKTGVSTLTFTHMTLRKLSSLESKVDDVTYETFAWGSVGTTVTANAAVLT